MTARSIHDAFGLLNEFLREDPSYLKSSAAYGDRGERALRSALRLFLRKPAIGFVWLVYRNRRPVGVCVVCHAISTSIGGLVVKLDDVFIEPSAQREGVGRYMLRSLAKNLRLRRVKRIDTSVYQDNWNGDRFYRALGFRRLGEERLAWVL